MKALLSIVIPVYNRASLVCRCLESVHAQSLRPLHLIVVDNNSSDATPQVISEWSATHADPSLKVTLLNQPMPGASAARALGLEAVDTPYVYFFDSDDAMRPDAARAFADSFAKNPEAQIVAGKVQHHALDGSMRCHGRRGRNTLINHFHHSVLSTQAYAVSTAFLREAGGWNPSLRIWDDWELGIRLLLRSPHVVWMNKVVADMYRQPDSVTGDLYSQRARHYPDVIRAVRRVLQECDHPDRVRLLRLLHGREMMLAALYALEERMDLALPLRAKVLEETAADPYLRLILRGAYAWRRKGLRGCDTWVTALL